VPDHGTLDDGPRRAVQARLRPCVPETSRRAPGVPQRGPGQPWRVPGGLWRWRSWIELPRGNSSLITACASGTPDQRDSMRPSRVWGARMIAGTPRTRAPGHAESRLCPSGIHRCILPTWTSRVTPRQCWRFIQVVLSNISTTLFPAPHPGGRSADPSFTRRLFASRRRCTHADGHQNECQDRKE
jgi:hypothetical protein